MEPLRFRVRQAFYVGEKFFSSGYVSLKQVFPVVAELISIGRIQEIPLDASLSDSVVFIRDCSEGKFGEVKSEMDLPNLPFLLSRGYVLRLYDAELNDAVRCEVCGQVFFTRELLAKHKEETGHRRPYRRKTLEEKG